jgi:hypothetical protein
MGMDLAGPETKNDCAGEDQQQFTHLTTGWPTESVRCESGDGTRSWWLAVSAEIVEFPLVDARTEQQLVKA